MLFGDADDPESMHAETTITGAVFTKSPLRAVGFEAVELADQAGFGPEAIDLVAVLPDLEPGVEAGARDVVSVEERQEELLKRAADAAAWILAEAVEAGADDRRAPMAWVAIEEGR